MLLVTARGESDFKSKRQRNYLQYVKESQSGKPFDVIKYSEIGLEVKYHRNRRWSIFPLAPYLKEIVIYHLYSFQLKYQGQIHIWLCIVSVCFSAFVRFYKFVPSAVWIRLWTDRLEEMLPSAIYHRPLSAELQDFIHSDLMTRRESRKNNVTNRWINILKDDQFVTQVQINKARENLIIKLSFRAFLFSMASDLHF